MKPKLNLLTDSLVIMTNTNEERQMVLGCLMELGFQWHSGHKLDAKHIKPYGWLTTHPWGKRVMFNGLDADTYAARLTPFQFYTLAAHHLATHENHEVDSH